MHRHVVDHAYRPFQGKSEAPHCYGGESIFNDAGGLSKGMSEARPGRSLDINSLVWLGLRRQFLLMASVLLRVGQSPVRSSTLFYTIKVRKCLDGLLV